SFTEEVISFGRVQVRPSSSDQLWNTRRVSVLVPALMAPILSSPRFQVINRCILPVSGSTTGLGLPQVLPPSSHTMMRGLHVLPLSTERRSTRSISPSSLQFLFLPSAKASSVFFLVRLTAGMRKQL